MNPEGEEPVKVEILLLSLGSSSFKQEKTRLPGQGVRSHITPPEAIRSAFSGDSTSTSSRCKNTDGSCGLTELVRGSIEARPEIGILGRSVLGRRGMREAREDRGKSQERCGAAEF